MSILEIISALFMISGSIFCLIGAYGVIKFPNFITRVHAASLIDSLGALLLIMGLVLHSGFNLISVKLIIILLLLFITGPTAIHAMVNTALHDDRRHIEPSDKKDSSSNT